MGYESFKVHVPLEVRQDSENGYTYLPDFMALGIDGYFKSKNEAKERVRGRVISVLREAEKRKKNSSRHIISTKGGEVLLVEWKGECWGYLISGPGRRFASGSVGFKSLDAAVEAARKHAESGFGGVEWEHGV